MWQIVFAITKHLDCIAFFLFIWTHNIPARLTFYFPWICFHHRVNICKWITFSAWPVNVSLSLFSYTCDIKMVIGGKPIYNFLFESQCIAYKVWSRKFFFFGWIPKFADRWENCSFEPCYIFLIHVVNMLK